MSPIEVDPDYSAERLVREVFANDRCETIFNVRQIGDNPDGIGYFSGAEEAVGFQRGILLSTGKVKDASGPNRATNTGSKLSGPTPDPDLDLVVGGRIFDRSGIEFDFVPLESQITFRYVFASEEYCEFVGAAFNDIFGFFISGPGFNGPYSNGAVNVALVPGTGKPVTINDVNYRRNREFYLDNESPQTRQEANCGGGTEEGPRFESIEYDGQTVILTATLQVEPCATYHIRLLVADVKDSDLDSAVFLEAGSFDLGSSVSLESEEGGDAPIIAYEGCSPAVMRVVRGPDSDPERDQVITYRVAADSEASDSLDFSAGTGSVTIPAGAAFAEVPIRAFVDTLSEGDERAWILLDVPCACFTDSVEVIIREVDTLSLGLGDPFLYCPAEGTVLTADVTGGVPPYSYRWSFGSTEARPEFRGALPDTIGLQVTDACGATLARTAATQASAPPTLRLPAADLVACWGETLAIPTELTGVGPFTLTYRVNGGPREVVELSDSSATWSDSRSGTYQVINVRDRACASEVNQLTELNLYKPAVTVDFTDPGCNGFSDGSLSIDHLPTRGPYQYQIDDRLLDGPGTDDLPAGSYLITVTDAIGCQDSTRMELFDPPALRPVTYSCKDLRQQPLRLTAAGGQAPYTYSVDGENFLEDIWSTLRDGDTYSLTTRDAAGCEQQQPQFYFPAANRQWVRLNNFYNQKVGGSVKVSPLYFLPPQQIASYRWSPEELFDCATCPDPTVTAPYTENLTLEIRDIFGCVDSVGTMIAVDGSSPLFVPNAFSPDGDGANDNMSIYANPDLVSEIVTFQIFTRWGELVYSENDFPPNSARRGWDGYKQGRIANSGAYLWAVTYRLYDGETVQETGTTILLRR
ncbi:choice-of-anchor L domain-containing protein [Lewinella sp. IMCC34183]|uniref:choice-of-anchor L domain-containing protein n=1 Tax=Lewinella sp. IMCC34183 TaxID=2248762 RepID=UPI0013001D66|nr:choice-of-anchor L domain-containing protein [Lewinella sp. IMCC34183]